MEEIEKPGTPMAVWLVVGILAIIGGFTILGWVFSAMFMLLRLAIVAVVVLLIVAAVRAFTR